MIEECPPRIVAVFENGPASGLGASAPDIDGEGIFGNQPSWGKLAAIDLHGCDVSRLADREAVISFIVEMVPAIGMEPHGPVHVDRFGEGDLVGWSAMQFIKTSSITVHADEVGGRCFVDIFSCKEFDAEGAAAIAVRHFGGSARVRILER